MAYTDNIFLANSKSFKGCYLFKEEFKNVIHLENPLAIRNHIDEIIKSGPSSPKPASLNISKNKKALLFIHAKSKIIEKTFGPHEDCYDVNFSK